MICAKCGTEIVGQPVECPNCGGTIGEEKKNKGYRIVDNKVSTVVIIILALMAVVTDVFYRWLIAFDSWLILPVLVIVFQIVKKRVTTRVFGICLIAPFIYQVLIVGEYLKYADEYSSSWLMYRLLLLILYASSIYMFYNMIRGKNRKVISFIIYLLLFVYDLYYACYAFILYGWFDCWISGVLLHTCYLLIVLSMSNDSSKKYATLESIPYEKKKGISKRGIGVALLLSIITCGIYYIYWRYVIIRDIRRLEGKKGSCVGECLLIIFIPFYDWYWLYTRANKLSVIGMNNGVKATGGGFLFVFLDIICFGWINAVLMQTTLNALANRMGENFVYGDIIQNKPQVVNQDKKDENVNLIYELNKMKENGIITEEEFETKKKEILSKM